MEILMNKGDLKNGIAVPTQNWSLTTGPDDRSRAPMSDAAGGVAWWRGLNKFQNSENNFGIVKI